MSTSIGHTVRYPHPLSAVRGAFTSEPYWKDRLEEVGGPGARLVGVSEQNGRATVEVVQAIAEAELPEAITKVRRGDLVIPRTEVWTDRSANFLATVEGAPVRIAGTVVLEADGDLACVSR